MAGRHPDEPGLRERKKRATRARLIDAATDLVDKQGYSNTTVEQIAQAVDVSPRTVAHYFPSKDRLLLAMVDGYAEAATTELANVPADRPPLRALLECNLRMLERVAQQQPLVAGERLAALLRVLHVSPPLQQLSSSVRTPAMIEQIAVRLGTVATDRRVELALSVWGAVVAIAWSGVSDLYAAGKVDAAGLPAFLKQRLIDAFDELAGLAD